MYCKHIVNGITIETNGCTHKTLSFYLGSTFLFLKQYPTCKLTCLRSRPICRFIMTLMNKHNHNYYDRLLRFYHIFSHSGLKMRSSYNHYACAQSGLSIRRSEILKGRFLSWYVPHIRLFLPRIVSIHTEPGEAGRRTFSSNWPAKASINPRTLPAPWESLRSSLNKTSYR